jgi:hypothetical protein
MVTCTPGVRIAIRPLTRSPPAVASAAVVKRMKALRVRIVVLKVFMMASLWLRRPGVGVDILFARAMPSLVFPSTN